MIESDKQPVSQRVIQIKTTSRITSHPCTCTHDNHIAQCAVHHSQHTAYSLQPVCFWTAICWRRHTSFCQSSNLTSSIFQCRIYRIMWCVCWHRHYTTHGQRVWAWEEWWASGFHCQKMKHVRNMWQLIDFNLTFFHLFRVETWLFRIVNYFNRRGWNIFVWKQGWL